jgi:hypothetical protein
MIKEQKIRTNTLKGKDPIISRRKVGRSINSVVDGSFLTRDKVVGMIPFLLFLLILAILYISNIYRAEKTIRAIDDAKTTLKELQYEFITSKSDLMNMSKRSEVAERLDSTGIKESTVPPERLYINAESTSTGEQKGKE